MVVIVLVTVLLLVGRGIEPGAGRGGIGRIEAIVAQQRADIEGRIVDARIFAAGLRR